MPPCFVSIDGKSPSRESAGILSTRAGPHRSSAQGHRQGESFIVKLKMFVPGVLNLRLAGQERLGPAWAVKVSGFATWGARVIPFLVLVFIPLKDGEGLYRAKEQLLAAQAVNERLVKFEALLRNSCAHEAMK